MTFLKKIFPLLIFSLVSCGGGGGSSDSLNSTPNPPISLGIMESCVEYGANTKKCSLTHKTLKRYYIIYVPESGANEINMPVLFALHGYGSTAENHKNYTYYEPLAETNKFIVVYPQGSFYNGTYTSGNHWNVGSWTLGSTTDDVDFIDEVIGLIINKESIDQNRIYSSGMSNGGFMSYHLACNLSSKIAAIVSVTGSMSKETLENCSPSHPTPVLQIHGTLDPTVKFDGDSTLNMEPIDNVLNYWSTYNSCDPTPALSVIDYLDFSIDYKKYNNCLNNVNVELYKISNMAHTWPRKNNYGISATEEVWKFVSQFDIYGKIN
jgi:polyhydroxybutyrate depolymerase